MNNIAVIVLLYEANMSSIWLDNVYGVISRVPAGKVVTYGQVAAFLGAPRASRAIGWALSRLPYGSDVPWQRVVNRKGVLSIVHPVVTATKQAELLAKEGVEVKKLNDLYVVDLKKHQFYF